MGNSGLQVDGAGSLEKVVELSIKFVFHLRVATLVSPAVSRVSDLIFFCGSVQKRAGSYGAVGRGIGFALPLPVPTIHKRVVVAASSRARG